MAIKGIHIISSNICGSCTQDSSLQYFSRIIYGSRRAVHSRSIALYFEKQSVTVNAHHLHEVTLTKILKMKNNECDPTLLATFDKTLKLAIVIYCVNRFNTCTLISQLRSFKTCQHVFPCSQYLHCCRMVETVLDSWSITPVNHLWHWFSTFFQ